MIKIEKGKKLKEEFARLAKIERERKGENCEIKIGLHGNGFDSKGKVYDLYTLTVSIIFRSNEIISNQLVVKNGTPYDDLYACDNCEVIIY